MRVEDGIWRPSDADPAPPPPRPFTAPAPVEAVFLDLPLLTGDEAPHAPHVAFTGDPWPGSVTLLSSEADADYALAIEQTRPAVAGTTLSPLPSAEPGVWDQGPALRVRLARGALASVGLERVLAGANAGAIGDGTTDH